MCLIRVIRYGQELDQARERLVRQELAFDKLLPAVHDHFATKHQDLKHQIARLRAAIVSDTSPPIHPLLRRRCNIESWDALLAHYHFPPKELMQVEEYLQRTLPDGFSLANDPRPMQEKLEVLWKMLKARKAAKEARQQALAEGNDESERV